MANTLNLFSTPFVLDELKSPEGIAALRDAILQEKARDVAGVQVSNIGGWHSNTQMLEWGGEAARALVYKSMTMADDAIINLGQEEGREYGWLAEMWANVSSHGNANQYHAHPGAYWSLVAYVDDGYEGADDPALGGELQLLDPRMPMVRMASTDLRFKDQSGSVQNNEPTIRPKTGMIVMFPSWLQHCVRPFYGTGTRISIAINLVIGRKTPKGDTQ